MSYWKSLALTAMGFVMLAGLAAAPAQITIGIGVAPVCPYGYYDAAPYNCAPYGYYGPEWFTGGVFIGAGQWFHGPANFRGHVDNRYHPEHGYAGGYPNRGEKPAPAHRVDNNPHFQGNEVRDGRGHGEPKK